MGVSGIGRERFLAQASRILASSLDLQATLQSVADLAVPFLGDWCVVDTLEEGVIRRRAVSAIPEDQAFEEEMCHYAPDPDQPRGVSRVIHGMGSERIHSVTDDRLVTAARGEAHLAFMRRLAPVSYLCVPLIARGQMLGSLMLLTTRSDRHYDEIDQALGEDLASRAALAVDNARLYERAEAALQVKDRFLAMVSHELRTPLNSVNLWCGLMRMKQDDPGIIERGLDAIQAGVRTQSRLIDDLLDVVRISSGKLSVDKEEMALADVVMEAVELVRPQAAAKQIMLLIDTQGESALLRVHVDRGRLRQAVLNLLTNAIKFTHAGGAIEVRIERAGEGARVVVRDDGCGITREDLPRVFEPFYQVDGGSASRGGLGLGLTIVRQLVELHGGAVSVDSEGLGRGTTFRIQLPAA
jgi:signal transduction histidine kinase